MPQDGTRGRPWQRANRMIQVTERFTFNDGRITVDPRAHRVWTPDGPVRLSSRALDILLALVEHRDRLVSKQELLELVWPDRVVEDNNLQVHVSSLRKLLGANAIVTVSGRGYRLALEPDVPVASSVGQRAALPRASHASSNLIGRDAILTEVLNLLGDADVHLVALTGTGGVGKSRLALEAVGRHAAATGQTATTVWLAPLADPVLLPGAIADSFGLQSPPEGVTNSQLADWLCDVRGVLLLDNVEHLADAVAELVATLLAKCDALTIMTTGRTVLGLPVERVVDVRPLDAPVHGADLEEISRAPAVSLLSLRAREAGCDLTDRPDELRAAAAICRKLGGLPLALELAAARLRLMSAAELLKRLEPSLPLLTNAATAGPGNRRTLGDTIDWSYRLLQPVERRLLRHLSVFAGGSTFEDLEAVALPGQRRNLLAEHVAGLLDHNLLQRSSGISGPEPRFIMLETIREFAAARLEKAREADRIRPRHAAHFLALAEQAEPHLRSGSRLQWLERLRAERHNLHAAFTWFAYERRDTDSALRLVAALIWFWNFDLRLAEGRDLLRRALELPETQQNPSVRAAALSGSARLAAYCGDLGEAEALATAAVAICRKQCDARSLGYALINHGLAAMPLGADGQALERLNEAARCLNNADDPWGLALAITLIGVAWVYRDSEAPDPQARRLLTEGRARFRALDDRWGLSLSSAYLGTLALRAGETGAAREFAHEMLADARELGDQYRIARTLHQLAEIEFAESRVERALPLLRKSLALNIAQQRRGDAAQQLKRLARAEFERGRPDCAIRLFAAAATEGAGGRTLPGSDPRIEEQILARLRSDLGTTRFEALWALGCGLSLSDALALSSRD